MDNPIPSTLMSPSLARVITCFERARSASTHGLWYSVDQSTRLDKYHTGYMHRSLGVTVEENRKRRRVMAKKRDSDIAISLKPISLVAILKQSRIVVTALLLLGSQTTKGNVIYHIFATLDVVLEAVKSSPQGIVSQVELFARFLR